MPRPADAIVPDLLEFISQPRTNAEVEQWLADHASASDAGAWWAIRTFAPVLRAPTGDTWSFGQRVKFISAGIPPASADPDVADAALLGLVKRYLEAFGPASIPDIAQFALVQRTRVRAAIDALADELEPLEGPEGTQLFDAPGAARPPADVAAPPRLLPMWDNTLLAYADRSRIIPPQYRKQVIRSNGDTLPTLLVDGYVAGVWRPVDVGGQGVWDDIAVEATAFQPLPDEVWEALSDEAAQLRKLIADREPNVYRRYDRWWAHLPSGGEVRVLPG